MDLRPTGSNAAEGESSLTVTGRPGGKGLGGEHGRHLISNHRIAMSFLVLGAGITRSPVTVDDGFHDRPPSFPEFMASCGGWARKSNTPNQT